MSQYRTGFISIDSNTNIVNGSQTRWLDGNIKPGDLFKVSGFDVVFEISNIESNSVLYLTTKWSFDSISGLSYIIARDFTPHYNLPEIHIGDRDWPVILTRTIRKMDSLFYKINTEGVQIPDGILQESRIATIQEIEEGVSDTQIINVSGLAHAISGIDSFSGDYADLSNKPASFTPSAHNHALSEIAQSGATDGQVPVWNEAQNKFIPGTVSGGGSDYTDLMAVSAINSDPNHGSDANHNYFSGDYADLSNKPASFTPSAHNHALSEIAQSGAADGQVPIWNEAQSKFIPGTISGGGSEYTDAMAVSAVNADSNHGSDASHNYFSGDYEDLSNKPASFTPSAHNHALSEIAQSGAVDGQVPIWNEAQSKFIPGTISGGGSGYTDAMAVSAINADSNHGSDASHNYFSGDYADLSNKPASFTPSVHNHALSEIAQSGAADGQVPIWNEAQSKFIPGTISGGGSEYTDAMAVSAINADSNHGSDASHNYFSGDYADLSNKPASFTPSTHNHALSEIAQSGAADGQVPIWNEAQSKFIPGTISGGGSEYTDAMAVSAVNADSNHGSDASHNYFSGDYADLSNKPTSFTPSAHNHSASDINSGVLSGSRLPNPTSSSIGGIKIRINGTTALITTNGTNA